MAGGERAGAVRQASEGLVASGELQEEVLVQLLPPGPLPSGQEDVAPDVLMHNAAALYEWNIQHRFQLMR